MLPLFSLKEHLTHTAKPFNKVFVGPTNPFALAENICLLPFKQNHQSDKFLRHREKKKKRKKIEAVSRAKLYQFCRTSLAFI